MWKVLIADDEPKIRRGLAATIRRLRPEMEVVAEAEDGETALALVQKEKPDILLVDIRMPFLNGLQLIERIQSVWRDCLIIVVTGHDEFQYAQRALQLRVFEYLLKPVARDALASVLARAEEELARLRRENRYLEWARVALERNMPQLREQLLRDWIGGRLSAVEFDEQASFLGIRLGERPGMAVIHLVERPLAAELAGEKARRLALFTLRSIAEEAFRGLDPVYVLLDEHDNIVVISGRSGGEEWLAAVEKVTQEGGRAVGQPVIVAERVASQGPEAVAQAYEALTQEIARRSGHRAFVQRAQAYLEEHYSEPDLALERVAAALQISPGYLSRLLRQETGFAFVEYLTRMRIAKAVRLMADPAVKVYEAAEAVGYESQHYFSRAFKKVLGCSPVEYRKGGR